MISFAVIPNEASREYQLLYRRSEYSFDVHPRPKWRGASISLNEVELEIDQQNRVLCVSGYCPYVTWRETLLSPPSYVGAGLVVVTPGEVVTGTSVGLTHSGERWPVFVNSEDWICVGDPSDHGDKAIEFAPSSVAVLRGDMLIALWLHPVTV
jgi:hypothetical protein